MTLRADHIAGGVFALFGVLVFVIGENLPMGTLAFPDAGFMPKLIAALMIVFGLTLALRASESPALLNLDWSGWWHAAQVIIATLIAALLYTRAGFIITIALLLFAVPVIIERKRWAAAALFSVTVTAATYALFAFALKTPIPRGPFGF